MKYKKNRQYLSLEGLEAAVARNTISPIYLFAGSEDFIADEGIRVLRDGVISEEERKLNFSILYGSDLSVQKIMAIALSFPMMGSKQLVVVKEFDKVLNSGSLNDYILNPLESTILVLVAKSPDYRKNPYKTIDSTAILDCSPIYDNRVPEWIVRRAKKFKIQISFECAEIMAAFTGTSLRLIENELDKLEIYCADRETITLEDIYNVVGISKEFNIFELYNAVGNNDPLNGINILKHMLEKGEPPVYILAMLTKLFAILHKLGYLNREQRDKDSLAREIGVHRYFLEKYLSYLNHHPSEVMSDRFRALLEADVTLKSTDTDPEMVLSTLLFRLVDLKKSEEKISG